MAAGPDDATTHRNYGRHLEESGDTNGAEREYERALELHPHDVATLNEAALLQWEARNNSVSAEVCDMYTSYREMHKQRQCRGWWEALCLWSHEKPTCYLNPAIFYLVPIPIATFIYPYRDIYISPLRHAHMSIYHAYLCMRLFVYIHYILT